MAELLIELFSEEIPARMQLQAARDFARLFDSKLKAQGIEGAIVKTFVGPRRLVLVAENMPTEQAAISEDIKGPREGAPQQAMDGFLRKVGLSFEQLIIENGFYLARVKKPGSQTVAALPAIVEDILRTFPWPKSMRWGTGSFRWVRPLKSILFLFDGAVVPLEFEGLKAGNATSGHRFLSSGEALIVSDFNSYNKILADNFVILDHQNRQALILKGAQAVCAAQNCELMEDQGLLEEVAGLNEYPTALLGNMDASFLTLPPEVIKTSMRTHQKYFAVRDKATGKMAAKFVIVSNMMALDGGDEIKRGNAKVLSARLSDGVFFWNEDNKPDNFKLWNEKLKGVTFHAKLGTMAQRVARIQALAEFLAEKVGADLELVTKAASLCKADLASLMVGEFPELQGVMGGYYADAAKIEPEVATAIREHYKPQGPSDSLPSTLSGAMVALADKLDTLIGFFAIDEKPTGSKDPYALRRSALGIVRIMKTFGLRLHLRDICAQWTVGQDGNTADAIEILDFFNDRLKVQWREEGYNPEAIEAVLAMADDDLVRAQLRLDALDASVKSEKGDSLLATFKRAYNILVAEMKKGPLTGGDIRRLSDAPLVESVLIEALEGVQAMIDVALGNEDYASALASYAAVREPLDAFLDEVLVNADDAEIRQNRLNILQRITQMGNNIAALSKFK